MNGTYQRFVLALIILFAGWLLVQSPTPTVRIGEAMLRVEIADTREEQEQGLSQRKNLREGEGMLFVFEEPGRYGFWMKDMKFPIDIIWIDSTKKVVGTMENVGPETFPQVFYPPSPVQYVLETTGGWAARYGTAPGDQLHMGR